MWTMPNHPQRVWPLQGATNFRDLGGYLGHDGRPVRWRRLFRSDHLGGLTETDKALLAKLGLAKAFDFRGQTERAAVSYELTGVTQHSLAIEPTVVQRMQGLVAVGQSLTPARAAELMTDLYRALVNDQAHRFAELFQHLLRADAPVVFHCTAGKDRTGLAAALILLALGVPRDVVLLDYLLTNRVFKHPPAAQSEWSAEVLAVLWRVQPDFLQAALAEVDAAYGSLEGYLREGLSLGEPERERLRSLYLAA